MKKEETISSSRVTDRWCRLAPGQAARVLLSLSQRGKLASITKLSVLFVQDKTTEQMGTNMSLKTPQAIWTYHTTYVVEGAVLVAGESACVCQEKKVDNLSIKHPSSVWQEKYVDTCSSRGLRPRQLAWKT